jgi:hypothetical protein
MKSALDSEGEVEIEDEKGDGKSVTLLPRNGNSATCQPVGGRFSSSEAVSSNPDPQVLAEFRQAGISLNARTRRLAALPWVTPAYIRLHREALEEAGKSFPQCAGLLITILESGEPAPEGEQEQDQDRKRYISGKYAEYIKH